MESIKCLNYDTIELLIDVVSNDMKKTFHLLESNLKLKFWYIFLGFLKFDIAFWNDQSNW